MAGSDAGSVPGYTLHERIGTGTTAEVWRGEEVGNPGRVYAIKHVTDATARAIEVVEREASVLERLSHPSVLQVVSVVGTREGAALIMPYAPGRSLARRIADAPGGLGPAEVADIGARLASALAAAHTAGVIHRDIKPANVLFDAEGQPLLSDFGVALLTGDAIDVAGTAEYLDPTLVEGRSPDTASDLYSLGVLLYEALAGVPPYAGSSPKQTLMAANRGRHVPLGELVSLPPSLISVVESAISRDPADRPRSAHEVAARLDEARREIDRGLISSWQPSRQPSRVEPGGASGAKSPGAAGVIGPGAPGKTGGRPAPPAPDTQLPPPSAAASTSDSQSNDSTSSAAEQSGSSPDASLSSPNEDGGRPTPSSGPPSEGTGPPAFEGPVDGGPQPPQPPGSVPSTPPVGRAEPGRPLEQPAGQSKADQLPEPPKSPGDLPPPPPERSQSPQLQMDDPWIKGDSKEAGWPSPWEGKAQVESDGEDGWPSRLDDAPISFGDVADRWEAQRTAGGGALTGDADQAMTGDGGRSGTIRYGPAGPVRKQEPEPVEEEPKSRFPRWLLIVAVTALIVVPLVIVAWMFFFGGDDEAVPGSAREPAPECDGITAPVAPQGSETLLADVEGQGCSVPVAWDGEQISAPTSDGGIDRFDLGALPDDVLLFGDWTCDGRESPALYRPSDGQIFTFQALVGDGEEVAVAGQPSGVENGEPSVVVDNSGCHRVEVSAAD